MRPIHTWAILVAGAVFFTASSAASLQPIGEPGIPAPQSAGFVATTLLLGPNDLYEDQQGQGQVLVMNQMIGILGALEAARQRPDDAGHWQSRARHLWNESGQSYDRTLAFFARTIPPPAAPGCIEAETNAWALLAAVALTKQPSPDPTVTTRMEELRNTLESLLTNNGFRGKPACFVQEGTGTLRLFQHPLALLALLELREASGDARGDAAIRADLNALLSRHFKDGGFQEAGSYQSVDNAQFLLVLNRAATLYNETALHDARDALADFVHDQMVRDEPPLAFAFALETAGSARQQAGIVDPSNQLWTAAALDKYDADHPGVVPTGLVGRLLEGLFSRYWDPEQGSFLSSGGLVSYGPNGLAALLTRGPRLQSVTREAPSLSVVIRSDNATPTIASSLWTVRFSLVGEAAPAQTAVRLAVDELAPMKIPAGTPARLSRLSPRADVETKLLAGPHEVIEFSTTLGPTPTAFTFDGRPPIVPLRSEFQTIIVVNFQNDGSDPLTVASLQLEVAATDVTVQGVLFNNVATTTTEIHAGVVTDALRTPHLRMGWAGLLFPPGESTLRITYSDAQPPTIDGIFLARDAAGSDRLPTKPPVQVTEGQAAHVFATVADNAVIRQVLALFHWGDRQVQLPMEPVPGATNLYRVAVPDPARRGPVDVTVQAIDAWGNLQERSVQVEIANPLLVGNQVLFVFSGILFLSSFVIWLKVRRKGLA